MLKSPFSYLSILLGFRVPRFRVPRFRVPRFRVQRFKGSGFKGSGFKGSKVSRFRVQGSKSMAISAELFCKYSQVKFLPKGFVLKDEHRTSNIERPTSNEKQTSNTKYSRAISDFNLRVSLLCILINAIKFSERTLFLPNPFQRLARYS
jgi:hypothetical protein